MASRAQNILITIKGAISGLSGVNKMSTALKKTATALASVSSKSASSGKAMRKNNASILSSANAYKGLVGQVASLNKFVNVLGATIRQVGQGFQNLGTTVTAFISIPVGLVIRGWTDVMFSLDDSLIAIRRSAGLTQKEMGDLKDGLVEISKVSPTSLKDLATIAEDVAKSGLDGTDAILAMVDVIDKLSVATDLNASESSKSLLKVINLFYKTGEGAKSLHDFAMSAGSAINSVGQGIVGSENEIVSALLRIAPAAVAAKMELPDLIGLVGTLVEMSSSPERAGTQAARAISQVAVNSKKLAESIGVSLDAFVEMNDADPAGTFISIAEAIARVESATKRQILAQEFFGQVGAKATNAIGAAATESGRLYKNIMTANKAFREGTSLQVEFDLAMNSVSKQASLLKNNLNVIAITIGDVLLPVITKIITYVVPAIRILSEWFEKTSDKTKLLVVGLGLMLVVIGPLLFAIGSLMFSIGIMVTGLTTAALAFLSVVSLPVKLSLGLLSLLTPARLVIAALVAIGAALVAFGGDLGAAQEWISTFITNMFTWGANAATAFSNGFASVTSKVASIISQFLETIAVFFRSNSPPVKGPLRNIDKWGRNAAQTFVDAFATARMKPILRFGGLIASSLESAIRGLSSKGLGAFGSVSSLVQSAARAIGESAGAEGTGLSDKINSATEAIANAIKGMMELGSVSGEAFDKLKASVGPFAEDFVSLINYQNKYNESVEALDKIRKQQSNIKKDLQDEIDAISKRTDLTIAEKSALIRSAKIKSNIREKELNDAEKVAEEQVSVAKKAADDQETIVRSLVDALNQINSGKKSSDNTDSIPGFGGPSDTAGKKDEATKKLDLAVEDAGTFFDKLSEAEKKVRAFWAGITGQGFDFENFGSGLDTIGSFISGVKLRLKLKDLAKDFDDAKTKIKKFFKTLGEIRKEGPSAILTPEQMKQLDKMEKIFAGLAIAIGLIKFGPGILAAFGVFAEIVGAISLPILAVAVGIRLIAAGISDMEPKITPVNTGLELLKLWLDAIVDVFKKSFQKAFDTFNSSSGLTVEQLDTIKSILSGIINLSWGALKVALEIVIDILGLLLAGAAGVVGYLSGAFIASAASAVTGVGNAIQDVVDFFVDFPENAKEWGKNIAQGFIDGWVSLNPKSLITNWITSGIIPMIKSNSPPTEGPLKDIDTFGKNIAMAFVNGWTSYDPAQGVVNWLSGILPFIESHSPPRSGPLSGIADWGKNIASSYIDAFSSAKTDSISDFANSITSKMYESVVKKITSIGSNFESLGVSVSSYIFDGIESGISGSDKTFQSIVDTAGAWLKKKNQDLVSFGKVVSSHIFDGIVAGIEGAQSDFDVISTVFTNWQSAFFSSGNAIVDAAKKTGKKISSSISNGIKLGSSDIGTSLVLLISGISSDSSTDLGEKISTIGGSIGGNMAGAIGDGAKTVESVTKIMNGIKDSLTGVLARYSNSDLSKEAVSIGGSIAGSIAEGIRSSTFPSEAIGNLPGASTGRSAERSITINFNGGVVVDSQQRVNDLADQISRSLGRSATSVARMGGGRRG